MNPLVDTWLRFVHMNGSEINITILVGGRWLTGMLTPKQRYEAWEKEVTLRALRAGGHFELPSLHTEAITPEVGEKVRQAWPELEMELYGESDQEEGFAYLCLRNVREVDADGPGRRFPFLIIATYAVAALMVGGADDSRPPDGLAP